MKTRAEVRSQNNRLVFIIEGSDPGRVAKAAYGVAGDLGVSMIRSNRALRFQYEGRRAGKTQRMLEAAEQCDARQVIIVAHNEDFARTLAKRFADMTGGARETSTLVRRTSPRYPEWLQEFHFFSLSRWGCWPYGGNPDPAVFIDHAARELV